MVNHALIWFRSVWRLEIEEALVHKGLRTKFGSFVVVATLRQIPFHIWSFLDITKYCLRVGVVWKSLAYTSFVNWVILYIGKQGTSAESVCWSKITVWMLSVCHRVLKRVSINVLISLRVLRKTQVITVLSLQQG